MIMSPDRQTRLATLASLRDSLRRGPRTLAVTTIAEQSLARLRREDAGLLRYAAAQVAEVEADLDAAGGLPARRTPPPAPPPAPPKTPPPAPAMSAEEIEARFQELEVRLAALEESHASGRLDDAGAADAMGTLQRLRREHRDLRRYQLGRGPVPVEDAVGRYLRGGRPLDYSGIAPLVGRRRARR